MVIVASSGFLYYFTYIDDAWSNANQGKMKYLQGTGFRPYGLSRWAAGFS
jgi:hypothetical protein